MRGITVCVGLYLHKSLLHILYIVSRVGVVTTNSYVELFLVGHLDAG